jgi:hypothetical protein
MKKLCLSYSILFFTSLVAFSLEKAHASKFIVEEAAVNGVKLLGRSFPALPNTQRVLLNQALERSLFQSKRMYSTSNHHHHLTDEKPEERFMKKLQIVDVGAKKYIFDPKTSMYYYEDVTPKDAETLTAPEIKEFDTFVEFDLKKK